ncbi:flagellar protein FlgN [Candidatus Nitrospira bockiana]
MDGTFHAEVETLHEVLAAMAQHTAELKRTLEAERDAIVGLSLERLADVTQAKLRVLEGLRVLEARRKESVSRLGAQWRMDPENLTVSMIAARTGPGLGERLGRQAARLEAGLSAVRRDNAVLRHVVDRSVSFLQQVLRAVQPESPDTVPLYGEHGAVSAPAPEGGLLRRRG